MEMIYAKLLIATNIWWTLRKDTGAHHFVIRNIPFLFEAIGALYTETRNLHLQSGAGVQRKQIDGEYVIEVGMFLQSQDYARLRSILSLMGDIYNLLAPLQNKNDVSLFELKDPIEKLYNRANDFRDIRNFFTHIGEILTDMDRHGITGAASTDCGIQYMNNAKGCVHLVWNPDDSSIHFTYQKKALKIIVDKSAFDSIFVHSSELYSCLVPLDWYTNQDDYPTPDKLFPL
jgi:hypothetical protein